MPYWRGDTALIGISVVIAVLATLGINLVQSSADQQRTAQIALARIQGDCLRMSDIVDAAYQNDVADPATAEAIHAAGADVPAQLSFIRSNRIDPTIAVQLSSAYAIFESAQIEAIDLLRDGRFASAQSYYRETLEPVDRNFEATFKECDATLDIDAQEAGGFAYIGADSMLLGALFLLGVILRRLERARQKTMGLAAERKMLRQSEARFQSLLRNVHDIISVLERDGTIRYISPAVQALTGDNQIDLMGASFYSIVRQEDVKRAQRMINQSANKPYVNFTTELCIRSKNGSFREVEVILINQMGEPEVEGFIATIRDVTERKSFEHRLTHQAYHDALTGLPNRKLFVDRLAVAMHRSAKIGVPVAVMFVDLDNFKVVNDSLGHQAGDALLLEVADRLSSCLRPVDLLARMGGDEFTVMIEEGDEVAVLAVANRIIDQLDQPIILDDISVYTTASVGIAYSTGADDETERLLRDADTAMYEAKTGGKGRYCVFDESMQLKAAERLTLESELRMAVERNEVRVHYQPIVELASGKVVGLEALMRWNHPIKQLLSPDVFIPVAEETGLIVNLGRYVLGEACRQLKIWQDKYSQDPPLTMSINISVRQFQHPRLVGDIADALHRHKIDPTTLKIEITESITLKDSDATSRKLTQLKELGVQLEVDDFGTGYSSMSYLKNFPIDTIKIDRSFVGRIGKKTEDEAIINAIITLANTLRLSVTSEGIETEDQRSTLLALGCRHGQGYYFARPGSPEEIEPYLAESRDANQLARLRKAA